MRSSSQFTLSFSFFLSFAFAHGDCVTNGVFDLVAAYVRYSWLFDFSCAMLRLCLRLYLRLYIQAWIHYPRSPLLFSSFLPSSSPPFLLFTSSFPESCLPFFFAILASAFHIFLPYFLTFSNDLHVWSENNLNASFFIMTQYSFGLPAAWILVLENP